MVSEKRRVVPPPESTGRSAPWATSHAEDDDSAASAAARGAAAAAPMMVRSSARDTACSAVRTKTAPAGGASTTVSELRPRAGSAAVRFASAQSRPNDELTRTLAGDDGTE